ncbi:MAG: hypothetical protein D6811_01625 [Alphaproteobacteria bacterium]|nr:MAG: hypothetical protein D6811_01625 [Alphaproteobacteria bacterium]
MRAGALLFLILAACAVPQEQPSSAALAADDEGLRPAGSELRIDFGRARDGVVEAVETLIGGPPQSRSIRTDCALVPVEVISWPDLELFFLDGAFAGLRKTGGGTPVVAGITCELG